MNAAIPARSSSLPSRRPMRVAKTWSARSSAVCRLRGEYSPTLLMCSTTPLNAAARERVDGDRHLVADPDPADARLGHVDAHVELVVLEERGRGGVRREDVARAEIERLDARRARGPDDELVDHDADLIEPALRAVDRSRARP